MTFQIHQSTLFTKAAHICIHFKYTVISTAYHSPKKCCDNTYNYKWFICCSFCNVTTNLIRNNSSCSNYRNQGIWIKKLTFLAQGDANQENDWRSSKFTWDSWYNRHIINGPILHYLVENQNQNQINVFYCTKAIVIRVTLYWPVINLLLSQWTDTSYLPICNTNPVSWYLHIR